jgi:transposase
MWRKRSHSEALSSLGPSCQFLPQGLGSSSPEQALKAVKGPLMKMVIGPKGWFGVNVRSVSAFAPGEAWPAERVGVAQPVRRRRRARTLRGRRPVAERGVDIAAELDVSPGQLSPWRNEQLAASSAEALAQKADETEMLRLRREVKRLGEENLILRKAAAFFAKGIA